MPEALVVFCTCPDQVTAARLATGLVENRLAACVNVLGGIRSIYRWQGEVNDDEEVLMVIKSTDTRFPGLERWVQENHPYEVPEIVAMPVSRISNDYLDWVVGATSQKDQQ